MAEPVDEPLHRHTFRWLLQSRVGVIGVGNLVVELVVEELVQRRFKSWLDRSICSLLEHDEQSELWLQPAVVVRASYRQGP